MHFPSSLSSHWPTPDTSAAHRKQQSPKVEEEKKGVWCYGFCIELCQQGDLHCLGKAFVHSFRYVLPAAGPLLNVHSSHATQLVGVPSQVEFNKSFSKTMCVTTTLYTVRSGLLVRKVLVTVFAAGFPGLVGRGTAVNQPRQGMYYRWQLPIKRNQNLMKRTSNG